MMNFRTLSIFAASVLACACAQAGEPTIRVSVGGEITPGVYGQVEIGNAPPPPVVYRRPVVIVPPPPRAVVVEPIYLHVPPGHAKRWSKHCREYDACGRPVYFVKSSEYEPKGQGKRGHGKGHGKDD